jgi:hypothetical protein
MSRKLLICIALLAISFIPRSFAQRNKSEFTLGYGYFSSYSIANVGMNNTNFGTSTGSPVFGYRYYISREVTLGMNIAYENISTWGSFVTIAPEMTFCYMDTRKTRVRVRLYGSASYGITLFGDNVVGHGDADETGAKPWGFHGSPFGIRIGRQFAGFLELGYGYKGLVHGGMSLRFPHMLRPAPPVVEYEKPSNSDQ